MENYKEVNGKKELVNHLGQTEKEFLEVYNSEAYKKPSVTVDMLIFTVSDKESNNYRKLPEKQLQILLVKRKDHPFIGQWAIPGGFVNMNESMEAGAMRELKEETNIDNVYMEQLFTWGDVERDPRMRVISTSYLALVDRKNLNIQAGDDAEDAKWFTVKRSIVEESMRKIENGYVKSQKVQLSLLSNDEEDKIVSTIINETTIEKTTTKVNTTIVDSSNNSNNIAFDHSKIINYALDRLINKLEYTSIAFNLMPERFTLTELQRMYEVILGKELIKPNFRRKIANMVIETDEYKAEVGHRPAKLFKFNYEWKHEF